MEKELKRKWLKALRSGEYNQIEGELRSRKGHCCLGVLCDVLDPSRWDDYDYDGLDVEFEGALLAETGLTNEHHTELIEMNDTKLMSFKQIAIYIERNV